MPPYATGVALVDRSGNVVAADPGFHARLGLPPDGGGRALVERAERDAALRALLGADAQASALVAGADGVVEIERVPAGDGAFLVCRAPGTADGLERAMCSRALPVIASGLAHEIKNPLNAMSLQLELAAVKLAAAGEGCASATSHLTVARTQIDRVNEVVRRFMDVADPATPLGFVDAGSLLGDVVALFGHEARRRRIRVALEAAPGSARTRCDPARLGRLVVGALARAFDGTPDGGQVVARARARDGSVELAIEHAAGDAERDPGYDTEVVAGAARALGGSLEVARDGGRERMTFRLPGGA